MASQAGIHRCNDPLSLPSICPCSHPPALSKPVILACPSSKLNLRLAFDGSHGVFGAPKVILRNHGIFMAVARAEPDCIDEGRTKEEVESSDALSQNGGIHDGEHRASQMQKRVLSGLGIGISISGAVLAGGWVVTGAVAAAVT